MDFSMSPEHEAFAKTFNQFCADKIAPRAKDVDAAGTLSQENWNDLKEIGWFRLFFTEEFGGVDADWLQCALAEEALAKACASTFLSAGASVGLAANPIRHFGTPEQKKTWLTRLCEGTHIGCFALTEPGAGTDAQAIKTRAKKTADGWVLNGEKALITNAPIADMAVVMAVTDPEKGAGGVTTFLVELDQKGVSRSAPYKKMGLRGSPTGSLLFEDVALDDSAVVGEVGAGFLQAMMTLEEGRIGMAHFGIGLIEAALESACAYATDRQAFGKPISRFQAVHFKIADIKVDLDSARVMARRAAWTKAQGESCADLASIAKLFATEAACRACDAAVQIHGGWGYTDDYAADRLYRDARLGPIGEGTSEIQRELLARDLLRL